MIIHYKVLGAMVTLREFDVHELAQLSGVNIDTVRTVVRRERALLENIKQTSHLKRRARGGRYYRYRVKEDAVQSLKNKVDDLFKAVPRSAFETVLANESQIPVRVLAAEDALLRLFPKAATHREKQHFVHLAMTALDDEAVRRGPIIDLHFQLLHTLKDLSQAEMDHDYEGVFPLSDRISALRAACISVTDSFRKIEQFEIASEIEARIQLSTLLHQQSPLKQSDPIQLRSSSEQEAANDLSVLLEVERITEIDDPGEQRRAAIEAAEDRLRSLPPHLVKSRNRHADNVLGKGECTNTPVLSDDEIKVFGTIPCFYFRGVVLRLEIGICLDMRELADAIVEYVERVPAENVRLVPEALIQYADLSRQACV